MAVADLAKTGSVYALAASSKEHSEPQKYEVAELQKASNFCAKRILNGIRMRFCCCGFYLHSFCIVWRNLLVSYLARA